MNKNTVTIIADPCREVRRAISLFDIVGVKYEQYKHNRWSTDLIREALMLTDGGFDDIVSRNSKLYDEFTEIADNGTYTEAVNYIIAHPRILKNCIFYCGDEIVVGYDADELSVFFPKEYRHSLRSKLKAEITDIANAHLGDVYTEGYQRDILSDEALDELD